MKRTAVPPFYDDNDCMSASGWVHLSLPFACSIFFGQRVTGLFGGQVHRGTT